jgi:uncharacterized membrane protein
MEVTEEGKTRALIAHMTLIGWIIAIATNNPKDDFASFYIRQMLGLLILLIGFQIVGMIFMFIPILGLILWGLTSLCSLGMIALWIMSLIGSTNGKKEPTPFIGQYFQQWFSGM